MRGAVRDRDPQPVPREREAQLDLGPGVQDGVGDELVDHEERVVGEPLDAPAGERRAQERPGQRRRPEQGLEHLLRGPCPGVRRDHADGVGDARGHGDLGGQLPRRLRGFGPDDDEQRARPAADPAGGREHGVDQGVPHLGRLPGTGDVAEHRVCWPSAPQTR